MNITSPRGASRLSTSGINRENSTNANDDDDLSLSFAFGFGHNLPDSYRRILTPLHPYMPGRASPNLDGDSKIDIEFDEDGFVRPSSGVPLKSLLDGSFRFDGRSKKIVQQSSSDLQRLEEWDYPGWGSMMVKKLKREDGEPHDEKPHTAPHLLDINRSTAIAGNDLLASVLYTTGLVCAAAGQNSPVCILLACLALYPFRAIFKEIGTALPLNGGVYVAMLNSSSKLSATFAASCSLISYSATAVVSAASCTSYAAGSFGSFSVEPVTIAVLLTFALLTLCGVKDSATVALAIFSFHLAVLAVLVIACLVHISHTGGAMFHQNWASPLPVSSSGGVGMDIFLGYSVALLGLTGFETSANYIEDCGPFETEKSRKYATRQVSIFEQTIDRMWLLVLAVNPTITICTLGVLDLPTILANPSNILSVLGGKAAGEWLAVLVSVDAIFVLAGGVLTAFVGVAGLIKQLAADRCLPSFLLQENRRFGTNHYIIMGFFALCTTLYLSTNGDITILSGVFSVAFILVLLSFALANMRLKFSRPRLPRGARASLPLAVVGFSAMFLGLIGNIVYNPEIAPYFLLYLFAFLFFIVLSFQRMSLAKLLLFLVRQSPLLVARFEDRVTLALKGMKQHTLVFFIKTSELHVLNKAILYCRNNELCDHLIIAHVHNSKEAGSALKLSFDYPRESPSLAPSSPTPSPTSTDALAAHNHTSTYPDDASSYGFDNQVIARLRENLKVLDHVYPKTKIDLLIVEADEFSPRLVRQLSHDLQILPSFMFVRCPGSGLRYNLGEFGGVRTIMQ